jgi:CPA1 family monovalent cation:H+ antiporter
MAEGFHGAQLVFLVLLFLVIAFAALARRLRVPYPIVLVIAGLLVSFVPGLPQVTLKPDLIFLVVLPPLLYAAAWNTSWRDFSYNLVSICSLAIGLVGFTVAGVALAANWILPGFDWRAGFVLGAVVSTTDAIAAASIARRLGLPRRIVDVLEGESLVNDATGLLALEFGVAMLMSGGTPSVAEGLFRFAQLVAGGIGVGLAVALAVEQIEKRIDDGPIEIALSILVPYGAYLMAESVRASGVLAVVAAGLYLSRKSSQFFSPQVRIQLYAVWDALTFVLNGLVFVLIGLQLPFVRTAIGDQGLGNLVLWGAAVSALVIALRLAWVFPGARISYLIRIHLLHQPETFPPARHVLVLGWTGMRGVIALAAAMSLPHSLPQRNLIIFLTFCVILATLVVQGLTLPALIRALGLQGAAGPACEEREARRIMLESALSQLEKSRAEGRADGPTYDDLALHYRQRLADVNGPDPADQSAAPSGQLGRFRDVSRELAQVERNAAIRLRDEGRIDDGVLRQLERELDLTEARLQRGHSD